MDFLNEFLAKYLKIFKANKPVVFMVVAAALTGVKYLIESGSIPINPSVSEWILWFIALVVGTHTTNILQAKQQ